MRSIAIAGGLVLFFLNSAHAFTAVSKADETSMYSKLTDRRCPGVTLDKCSNADARVMRAYVSGLLDQGAKEEDVAYAVSKRFSVSAIADEGLRAKAADRLGKDSGDKRPLIIVDAMSYDFGKLSKKSVSAKHSFTVKNAGTAPLLITKMRVSCSCTTANLILDTKAGPVMSNKNPKLTGSVALQPGQAAQLEVIFDLASPAMSMGTVHRTITLITNDSMYPETTIGVKATVTP